MRTRVAIEPIAIEMQFRLFPRLWLTLLCLVVLVGTGLASWSHDLILPVFSFAVATGIVLACMKYALIPQYVRVTKDHLFVPRSRWSRDEVAIRFTQMLAHGWQPGSPSIEVSDFFGDAKYEIHARLFRSYFAFETLCQLIRERVDSAGRAAEEKLDGQQGERK